MGMLPPIPASEKCPSTIAVAAGIQALSNDIAENLLEIYTRKSGVGRPTKVYKPGRLMETYHDPIFSYIIGKEREAYADFQVVAAIRCSIDPMKCPDQNCRICANDGIKTCWTGLRKKGKAKKNRTEV